MRSSTKIANSGIHTATRGKVSRVYDTSRRTGDFDQSLYLMPCQVTAALKDTQSLWADLASCDERPRAWRQTVGFERRPSWGNIKPTSRTLPKNPAKTKNHRNNLEHHEEVLPEALRQSTPISTVAISSSARSRCSAFVLGKQPSVYRALSLRFCYRGQQFL
jgi:hypothetical protein